MYPTIKNRLLLLVGLLGAVALLLTCGTDQTGSSPNPATRPTPGFGLISGQVDLNSEDLSVFSSLKLPAVSIGSSTPALHVNLGTSDDESADGGSDVLVVVTNSTGDSFSTVTNDDGSFAVKARKGVASRLELFAGDKYLATMVFGVDTNNSRTTDTFLLDNSTEAMDLGVIAQRDQWAVPEVNPLEPADGDDGEYEGSEDTDSDSSSEDIGATVATIRTFTMEGKTLNRDMDLDDFDEVTIIDSTINGHVSITNSEHVFIDPTGVSSLSIANSGNVILEELSVESELVLDSIDDLQMTRSHVVGDTSMQNIGSGTIENSEFEGEFATDDTSASAITEKWNSKGKAKGEEMAENETEVTHDRPAAKVERTTPVRTPDIARKDDGEVMFASNGTVGNIATSTPQNKENSNTRPAVSRTATVTRPIVVNSGNGPVLAMADNRNRAGNTSKTISDTDMTASSTDSFFSNGMIGYLCLGLCLFLCFFFYLYLFFRFAQKRQQREW